MLRDKTFNMHLIPWKAILATCGEANNLVELFCTIKVVTQFFMSAIIISIVWKITAVIIHYHDTNWYVKGNHVTALYNSERLVGIASRRNELDKIFHDLDAKQKTSYKMSNFIAVSWYHITNQTLCWIDPGFLIIASNGNGVVWSLRTSRNSLLIQSCSVCVCVHYTMASLLWMKRIYFFFL